jgi:hypothetical protein
MSDDSYVIAFLVDDKVCHYLGKDAKLNKQTLVPDPTNAKVIATEALAKRMTARYNQTNQWNQGIYKAMPRPNIEFHRSFSRKSEYPNVLSMPLNDRVHMEVHEYPTHINGNPLPCPGAKPFIEQTGVGEYIIRGLGFKIVLTRKK